MDWDLVLRISDAMAVVRVVNADFLTRRRTTLPDGEDHGGGNVLSRHACPGVGSFKLLTGNLLDSNFRSGGRQGVLWSFSRL